jgi:hypothetical protein
MTEAIPSKKGCLTEAFEKAAEERKAAEDQAFANKLAKRSPPNEVERAEIERARKRTKARAPRVAGGPLDQRATPSRRPATSSAYCRPTKTRSDQAGA